MRIVKAAWLVCVVCLLGACSAQKDPAEKAFAQIQASVEPVRTDLEKYAPEEYDKLLDLINQMKSKLNDKDYAGVLALQAPAMAQLMAASGATAKHRQEAQRQLATQWKSLAVAVPGMLAELNSRMTTLRGAKRLPAGVSADGVSQVEAQLPSLTAGWSQALAQSRGGNMDMAVNKAKELQQRCLQSGALLGLNLNP